MKTKIIQNPYSSRWKSKQRTGEMEAALSTAGLTYDLTQTDRPGQAIDLAAQAVQDGYEVIVGAGGDGTLGEVVNGILRGAGDDHPPKFGIMPMGTANDLYTNLKQPVGLEAAAQVIAAGNTKMIDVGQVNDRYFINNSGLGLEPYVTTLQEKMQRVHGITRYIFATFQAIGHNPQWEMSLEWDAGSYSGPVTLVSVNNCPLTGGVFYTAPSADPFDGKLTFSYGYIKGRGRLLTAMPKLFQPAEGNITEHPAVHEIHTTQLKVNISPLTPAHADGELFSKGIDAVHYQIHPAKVPILVS